MSAPVDNTETGMANGALALIGEPPIVSLDDKTRAAARHCKKFFAETRDELLTSRDWQFARNSCVPSAQPNPPNSKWAFRYVMPADCIDILDIDPELSSSTVVVNPGLPQLFGGTSPDWERPSSGDDTTVAILLDTNAVAPLVWYTRRVVNPAQWEPLFAKLFKTALAEKVNPLIGRDKGLTEKLGGDREKAENRASQRDAQNRNGDRLNTNTSWVAARYGAVPWRP